MSYNILDEPHGPKSKPKAKWLIKVDVKPLVKAAFGLLRRLLSK